ncbi:MAG: hypothetical protein MUC97_02830 [Bernardetiaceae bacterium]|jgi:hypothetical protein|nr:hypothetical protein [Bernardetiaceae bacterium]
MINHYRQWFNQNFTPAKYQALIAGVNQEFDYQVAFKICETPIFIPDQLKTELEKACQDVLNQVFSPAYQAQMHRAVPEQFYVPGDTPMPTFAAIDFAVARDPENPDRYLPQLIELQGFPSLFGFQEFISTMYRRYYGLPGNLIHLFPPELQADESLYFEKLRLAMLGGHHPDQVILMEIEPEKQKTYIDFLCTQRYFGIKPVCITRLRKQGRKLYYEEGGHRIWVERIYNRVIFDELVQRPDLDLHFSFRDELDVSWAGHPNWFFKMSKFTLPFLNSRYVPTTYFLNELKSIPDNLDDYVLKPLFSFAGAGVKFGVSQADLDQVRDPSNFILMKKVQYAPEVTTLDLPAKAEIRLLVVNVGGKLELLTNLVRLSKGKMMGVDFNKGLDWVGGSIGFFERD